MSTPVFSYREADFLDIGTAATPNVLPLLVVTQLDESPQAKTTERAYVPAKNATVLTTGYQTQFPFNTDEYEDDEVTAFIRDIAEEQKLGVQCPYYKVRLHQPIEVYAVTASAPADWATKYKDYYTVSGGVYSNVTGAEAPQWAASTYYEKTSQENTYYARKFTVGFAIDSVTREAGGIKTISGNMNAIGDVVIGTFNTTDKAFTPNN